MIIKTERLLLKNIEDTDKDELIDIINNPLVKKTYMLPDLFDKESSDLFFQKLKNLTNSNKYVAYGIYLKDKIIGFINSVSIENDTIEMGYFIAPDEWNNGYATEAFKAVIKQLFDMGFKNVEAAHFSDNYASQAVIKKCGLKRIDKEERINYRNKEHIALYYQIKSKL